jgi:F-type H+-transporting ATPase subunit a
VEVPAGPARQPTTSEVLTWVAGVSFAWGLSLMICVIEAGGTVIKSGVLAVRLFANMFAGHTVLAMILSFIILAANAIPLLWGSITFASVLGVVALSLLELFVAFLQSYIFVFLTALFMGMALNPQH